MSLAAARNFGTPELVKTVVGDDALTLLSSPGFLQSWTNLHDACPWATVFQSSAFVLTWFRVYASVYEPVVIHHTNGETLGGLLIVARDKTSGAISNAGTHHAEYHAWLALPEHANEFPGEALAALRGVGQSGTLRFLFLAPGTPLDWIQDEAKFGLRTSVRWHKRGLMRVGPDSEIFASFRKSSNKSRISRLKRIGAVSFTQLSTPEQLAAIIEVVADYCDVRQGGRNESLPFRSDPLKAGFYLAAMSVPGLMHVTALRAGDELLAFHAGFQDKKIALGLITHAPQFAAHSPGKLVILFLGKLLGEQGYAEFDLTPGQSYKDRFATHSDDVAVLEVFLDGRSYARYRMGRQIAAAGRWVERRTGVDLRDRLGNAKQVAGRMRRAGVVKLGRAIARRAVHFVGKQGEFRYYEYPLLPAVQDTPSESARLRVNNLRDLLAYQPAGPGDPSIIEFLELVVERLAGGGIVFTYAEGGVLLHYSWLTPATNAVGSEFGHALKLAEERSNLWDDFTHPSARGRGLHQESLRTRVAYASTHALSPTAIIGVRADNAVSRHNIEKAGFEYIGSAWLSVNLGREQRWTTWQGRNREAPVVTAEAVVEAVAPDTET
ncbi:MAG: GNAT family N-acetyltransferase [Phycisphaerae bacterium]|nr:GNAT family N-acetyltransferase [Gemmatimonadaceae bacterium]